MLDINYEITRDYRNTNRILIRTENFTLTWIQLIQCTLTNNIK